VDFWAAAAYRTAKYIIQITQGSDYQSSEMMVLHDGTNTKLTEYAVLEMNGVLGLFTTDINTGSVRLRVTMTSSTAATLKITRKLIAV
jgi:hypothetical protein